MDDDFGAAHIIQQIGSDFRKLGLVFQELGSQAMHCECALFRVAFRIDVKMQIIAGKTPIQKLHATYFNDAVARARVQAGCFCIEENLSHVTCFGH